MFVEQMIKRGHASVWLMELLVSRDPLTPDIFIPTFNLFSIRLDNMSSLIFEDEVVTYQTHGAFSPEEGMDLHKAWALKSETEVNPTPHLTARGHCQCYAVPEHLVLPPLPKKDNNYPYLTVEL